MWCWEYSAVLESIAKFEQTYIKISKYGNSVFPYSLHSPANLPAWRPKDRNVALMSFLRLFTETITPQRKSFFSKLHDKYCQNWQNSWRIVNTTFSDVITKIGTFLFVTSVWNMNLISVIRNFIIRNKKELLKELSPKIFS